MDTNIPTSNDNSGNWHKCSSRLQPIKTVRELGGISMPVREISYLNKFYHPMEKMCEAFAG